MQPRVLKYLLDIETVIEEIESFKELAENNFEVYRKQQVIKRAVERNLEIIGEAIKGLKNTDETINIPSSKKIIGLRNLISHSYDSVEDELIWGIIQKDLPKLYEEVQKLKNGT
jgi:uncharacterized protein with HEPN domain